MARKYNILFILGIGVLFAPILFGIFHPGFFVSDDGHWMVIRLSAFYEALSSGQFPVRFLPRLNQGYGYPVADFLYPLFLYIGSLLHVLKLPYLFSIKIILSGSILVSGIGMYLFLKKFFRTFSAVCGAIFYVYFPYHVYDLYIRGSVGEVLALGIVPFLFWEVEKKSWVLSSIFLGMLILSHNTLALLFLPVVVVYAYVRNIQVRSIVLSVCFGLLFSAFFWLPALWDQQYTVFAKTQVALPFAYFVDHMSYNLVGWISVVVFGGVLLFRSFFQKRVNIFFMCLGLLSLFLSFSISTPFWNLRAFSQLVQFPFRFLSLALVSQSFLAAFLIEKLTKKVFLVVLFACILGFSAYPYLFPRKYDYSPDIWYATNVGTTTVQNEYMPKWVTHIPTSYAYDRISLESNSARVRSVDEKGTKLSFAVLASKSVSPVISWAYFPGWQVRIDGEKIATMPNTDGLLSFSIPKGTHTVQVWFGETPLRMFADMLSMLSLLVVCGFLVKRRYEK